MKSAKVKGQKREALGKKHTKKLRAQELIPAVLYGAEEVIHLTLAFSELRKLVYTPNVYIIDLDIDGEEHKAIIQDIQWHPVEEQILHVDFLKVTDDKPISVRIPIVLTGMAKGIKAGGRLKTNMRNLRVRALPKFLPDTIDIDITNFGIGDSIKVEELKRDNLEFQDNKSNLIVGIISSRAAMSAMELPEDEVEVAEGEEAAEGVEVEGAESADTAETKSEE